MGAGQLRLRRGQGHVVGVSFQSEQQIASLDPGAGTIGDLLHQALDAGADLGLVMGHGASRQDHLVGGGAHLQRDHPTSVGTAAAELCPGGHGVQQQAKREGARPPSAGPADAL